jgi:hypothetical protein
MREERRVLAELEDLALASSSVAKVAWGEEPVAVVGEGIEAAVACRQQGEISLLLMVRSFEARGEFRAEGHVSMAKWLQHHCHLRAREAQRIARLGRFLSRLPEAEAPLRDTSLGLDHLEVLASAYRERFHEAWAEAAPLLLGYAARARFEDYARRVQRFADHLSPRDADDRFEDQVAGRRLFAGTSIDGFGYLTAWMDPVSYQMFKTELDRLIKVLFDQDWAAARDVLGRDPQPIELQTLTRSPDQRAHDALVEMARRSKSLAGGAVTASPTVVIHATAGAFEAGLARYLGDDSAGYPAEGFCETEAGTVLSPLAAAHYAIVGQVQGIVFDDNGHILSFGRSRRLFTPAQAAALRAQFRRCTHPFGCDRTGPRLQTDHLVEHQDGGATDIDNGRPKCATHNRWKTNQRGQPPPPTRGDTDQRRAPPDLGF